MAFSFLLQLLSLTFFLCIIFLFYSSHHRRRFRSHSSIEAPCPESYPIIGNLLGLLRNRHRLHDWATDMLSSTPSLVLRVNTLSSHGVCTANPAVVRHLLQSNFSNYIKGSRYRSVLRDLLGDGIFAVDGDLWFSQRKIASIEFTTRSLKHFIADTVQEELSGRLFPLLSAACDGDDVIDLQELLCKFTFDNICNVAFGVDPESLCSKKENPSKFTQAFDDAVEISFGRFLNPVQAAWKIKRALNLGSERKLKEAIQLIDDYATQIINRKLEDRKRSREENNQDLLSRFMDSSAQIDFRDDAEKRRFLRDIVISFILAGKDSTSTALTWFFWLISGHSRCRDAITAEISYSDSGNPFSYEELKGFHYLHAALSEALRLFPPVAIDSRLTVRDDVLPDGTRVGRGWFADYSAYAMGRMEMVWGSDCREFKPERWLDGDGNFQPSDQFMFPVFHCGPRMCLGKEMAYLQMKLVVATVMREFDVVAVDGGATPEKMMNPPYTVSMLLKMRGGLPVRLRRRPRLTN